MSQLLAAALYQALSEFETTKHSDRTYTVGRDNGRWYWTEESVDHASKEWAANKRSACIEAVRRAIGGAWVLKVESICWDLPPSRDRYNGAVFGGDAAGHYCPFCDEMLNIEDGVVTNECEHFAGWESGSSGLLFIGKERPFVS